MTEAYDEKQARLRTAFDKVADPTDWKGKVNGVIDAADVNDVVDAVIYFTGTVPTVTPARGGKLRVRSVGYRMGPCGP